MGDDERPRGRASRRVRRSSIDRARLKRPSRPFAELSIPAEVLAEWRPIDRIVQLALAIVAASDARIGAASAWPGEQPGDFGVTPDLVHAAEGGVSVHVRHRLRPSEAFGTAVIYLDSRATQTEFRLFANSVVAKDGDWRTWHRTAFRMAELVEAYAVAYSLAKGRTAQARARAAGRALSGLSARAYRRWERVLEIKSEWADPLWALLGGTVHADHRAVALTTHRRPR